MDHIEELKEYLYNMGELLKEKDDLIEEVIELKNDKYVSSNFNLGRMLGFKSNSSCKGIDDIKETKETIITKKEAKIDEIRGEFNYLKRFLKRLTYMEKQVIEYKYLYFNDRNKHYTNTEIADILECSNRSVIRYNESGLNKLLNIISAKKDLLA